MMKAFFRSLVFAAPIAFVVVIGCKKEEPVPTGPGPTTVVVNGVVTDQTNGQPISAAAVLLTTPTQSRSASTLSDGSYSFILNLGDTIQTATLNVSKSGYRNASSILTLSAGQSLTADFSLVRDTTTVVTPPPPGGGYANTIAYVGPATMSLAVFGVGGNESGIITFEARDSLGFPIGTNRADTITFSITGVPVAGGAYITPTSAITNSSGRGATVIQSGTVAGTVQLQATLIRDTDGAAIRSTPVKVIIHGGLPDQTHFALGANPFNVAGYYKIGATSNLTALVGDKYGNPVAPGTAVYFGNPDQGVVTTSTGYTTTQGFASVTLFTGPNHQPTGLGFVYAQTIGENAVTVRDSVLVLFSGNAYIDSVRSLAGPLVVDDVTQAVVEFRVYDERFNPLASGTSISSEVKGASAITSEAGPTSQLADVISPFWTTFRIIVSKNQEAVPLVTGPFSLTITVNGPNGKASASISGTVN